MCPYFIQPSQFRFAEMRPDVWFERGLEQYDAAPRQLLARGRARRAAPRHRALVHLHMWGHIL